jgi:predicted PhzF superfamily epimerase YddE/YHI9
LVVKARIIQPNIARLHEGQFGPVSVTARSVSASYDFVSCFFWPTSGIAEDPVSGVAHCSLGPYWAVRLAKADLVGQQVSPRGGIVRVRLRGERVDILGQVVTVMRGEILT